MPDEQKHGASEWAASESQSHAAGKMLGRPSPINPAAIDDPRYIIGRPHPDRARQFMPFASLKGYYELLRERERNQLL